MNSPANRILVVEDDPDVGVLLERVLCSAGYQVDRATTASGARLFVEAQEYRLVLADGILPDGTGIEVADAAKARGKARGMKALIITGYGLRLSRLGGFDRHDFILKPNSAGPAGRTHRQLSQPTIDLIETPPRGRAATLAR